VATKQIQFTQSQLSNHFSEDTVADICVLDRQTNREPVYFFKFQITVAYVFISLDTGRTKYTAT
jgi:hypothetical protein